MQLRDYQIKNAQTLAAIIAANGLAYFAAEVRTGKTLTALHVALLLDAQNILFVTKKKALSSIDSDIELYATHYKGLNVCPVNYEQLHKVDNIFDFIIIDEAHSLGAFPTPSERAKELKRICKPETKLLYLSGTPSPESYSQFFHQFWISENSPWNDYVNFYKWAKDYVTVKPLYVYNRELKDYSDANEEKIREDISGLMVSFSQQEAGFEQYVEDVVLTVPMPEQVGQTIKILKRDRVMVTKGGNEILCDTAVKMMNKIHQICSGTVKDEKGEMLAFNPFKAEFIKHHFAGQKIAIFYKFVAEKIHLLNVFGQENITEKPEEFNRHEDLVFISQIQSGREGINLSTADALVMYNIDFSAVSYWQARARLQSKDRTDAAKVYWIMSEGGIEQKIFKTVNEKKDYTLNHFNKDFTI
jgi:SNF2 family DNA or RNA helicase